VEMGRGKPVTWEMIDQLEESLTRTHVLLKIMFSTDPKKDQILKRMQRLMDEVMELYGDFRETLSRYQPSSPHPKP